MRHERFPNQRKSKLSPRGDGPFRVIEKINDNAYKLELPGELNISPTFNVTDLAPFDAEEPVLRSEPFQEGGNDEDLLTIPPDPEKEVIAIPQLRRSPRTRSGYKSAREDFNKSVESLITLLDHEELKGALLTTEISQETPIEPDNEQDLSHKHQGEDKDKGTSSILFKTPRIAFLPVLQGTQEAALFTISKTLNGDVTS